MSIKSSGENKGLTPGLIADIMVRKMTVL